MANDLPVVITKAGLQPQSPAVLLAQLLAAVASTNPGYTANFPGIMIEDISSTDVAAIVECDSARVETVNSLTPFGANDFLLNQIGQMLGVPLGTASNTSVFVQFTSDSPGFVIGKGFTVSDSTNQYVIQDGGTIRSDGTSPLLFAVANVSGTWAVPANSVTELITSVPTSITLSVTNPQAGLPGSDDETSQSYRARVLTGMLAASQGMARYLKTLLGNVEGVQTRLISTQLLPGVGWRIIVGGGDPYEVAYAIYFALFNIADVVGSQMVIESITNALPAVVTTLLNHGYSDGQAITISDSNPTDYDGNFAVAHVISEKTFRLGTFYDANNIASQSWSGGTITWNTTTAHGVTVGTHFTIVSSLPSGYSGTFVAISGTTGSALKATAADPGSSTALGQLSAGISNFDSTGLTPYVDSAILTPNFRNITVTLIDYPDTYPLTFINPPQQSVVVVCTWNTNSPNFVSAAAVAQEAGPAIVDYVNSVFVGQPMNLLQLEDAFQAAVVDLLPTNFISKLEFSVSINGVPTSAVNKLISGDPESYFFAVISDVTVVQG